ncbi:hypothetical protein NUW58_g8827 [Xylaria curta]|uniref:Uncharacterized protein n=1 Tax=Xylaria curta TaxID=42375 RepID=A0ACC1N4G9_9PEZI|nr:hypothetical protein NUW58_g8827 [Xylaria curta]
MEQDAAALQQVDEENELKAIAMRPKSSTGTSFLLPVEADIDTSPYASPLLTIHLADGPPLSIHKRLLDKCPNLSSACRNSTILHLANVPSSAGHVLTHYLFTGVYECLKPRTQCHKTNAAEFATAIRVYEVALEYELLELASLAGDEIEKLGARLPVLQLFDVLKDTLPNHSIDDMRLQSYLKLLFAPSSTTLSCC